MLTCKSPRKVMRVAYHLASLCLPPYSSKFSRKDGFTLLRLFACLVVREQMRLSCRGAEALLLDCEHWCRDVGMDRAPDHNTLCRAFHAPGPGRRAGRLLDVLAQWFAAARQLGGAVAIDSSRYDTHHRSRHYEQRRRHYAARATSAGPTRGGRGRRGARPSRRRPRTRART
jgi:hypothetical protein